RRSRSARAGPTPLRNWTLWRSASDGLPGDDGSATVEVKAAGRGTGSLLHCIPAIGGGGRLRRFRRTVLPGSRSGVEAAVNSVGLRQVDALVGQVELQARLWTEVQW